MRKKVCIVGLGYIGLPTAAILANNNFEVIGVDINKKTVDIVNEGKIHIVEPGLELLVANAVNSGNLKANTIPIISDIYMICVPTPFHENENLHLPNIDYVVAATESISRLIKKGDLIILESTSPVGTTELVADTLANVGVEIEDVYIAYCPERVVPGKVIEELVNNDRVVGGINEISSKIVSNFYRQFVKGAVLETDARTAEMCKLTENSFRDVNIAFANELSIICDKEGIDVWKLINLANRHPRVNVLQPGSGVGGHCIAVDPWFIVARNREDAKIIKSAREVNNYKSKWVIDKIKSTANNFISRTGKIPTISCLGLSFKPDIDDLRESPAVNIVLSLIGENFNIKAVEPNINAHEIIQLISYDDALKSSDIIVVLVKHKEFLNILEKINQNVSLLDFCGIEKQNS
jgi:UDP-N-acetyl-D-mannosaminuronic acid dehydrogenase